MIRALWLFLLLIGGSYAALWAITSTPIFKDKARVRAIIKNATIAVVSIMIAVILFVGIFVVEHQI